MAIAGRQSRDLLTVDQNILGIVATSVIELVWTITLVPVYASVWDSELTVHGDAVTSLGRLALSLHRSLRVFYERINITPIPSCYFL